MYALNLGDVFGFGACVCQTQNGRTALIRSARRASGHTDCVRLLLERGADTETTEDVWFILSSIDEYCFRIHVL